MTEAARGAVTWLVGGRRGETFSVCVSLQLVCVYVCTYV